MQLTVHRASNWRIIVCMNLESLISSNQNHLLEQIEWKNINVINKNKLIKGLMGQVLLTFDGRSLEKW